jgi:PAS domain S-box-containing protein
MRTDMAKTSKTTKNKPRLNKAKLAKEIEAKPVPFSGLSVEAFLLLDENLNLLSINDAGQKMFGVSRAGVFGKCILDVIPDIKNTGIYKKYRHVLKTGKSIVLHLELGGKHLSVQLFKQGDALGMIAADITERKRVEEALKESEVSHRELFENMSSGVAVYKAINEGQDFVFKDFNKAGEGIDKMERRDVIGKSVLEVFPGVKDFSLFDVFRRVWSTGNPEHHPISLYKDKRIVGWRENYVYKLSSGEIVAIYDDITERKRAEEHIRYQASLIENVFDAIISTDLDFNILSWNKAADMIYGWRADEVIGKAMRDIVPTEYVHETAKQVLEYFQREGRWEGEVIQRRKDGTPVNIWASVTMVRDSVGNPVGAVAINRDITERKQAEEALRESTVRFRELFENMSSG